MLWNFCNALTVLIALSQSSFHFMGNWIVGWFVIQFCLIPLFPHVTFFTFDMETGGPCLLVLFFVLFFFCPSFKGWYCIIIANGYFHVSYDTLPLLTLRFLKNKSKFHCSLVSLYCGLCTLYIPY